MTNIYEVDIHVMAKDLLPKEERTEPIIAATESVLSPVGRMASIFNNKKQGADVYGGLSTYAGGTYSYNDKVIYYKDGGVYECIVASTTDNPTITTSWTKVADSFIGYDESQYFNGSKLILEYALNRRFLTAFQQPPATSEIYIDLGLVNGNIFYSTDSATTSSVSFDGFSLDGAFDGFTVGVYYMFNIWVPVAVYIDLGTDAEQIIRNFVDKYITAGITYSITTY